MTTVELQKIPNSKVLKTLQEIVETAVELRIDYKKHRFYLLYLQEAQRRELV